ncbi:hypothetical protein PP175_25900 (plasmid) [Aneurinibacillus sp. Ricciae_BoGa-3]|uniref:hypothetical protein n=1 Tax=Aneurinibacillus sp. Ricciae_BoGa-3 TaxID=3022697 RepID=UPI0023405D65|nr:hypothetical protein [Aneurinibacillus sp. Ricciae_BoGa-3]WCK57503.1 hypothetical protein PP175_25900 [Aneurinibacillus sp. Ricciae_BoGa-3]
MKLIVLVLVIWFVWRAYKKYKQRNEEIEKQRKSVLKDEKPQVVSKVERVEEDTDSRIIPFHLVGGIQFHLQENGDVRIVSEGQWVKNLSFKSKARNQRTFEKECLDFMKGPTYFEGMRKHHDWLEKLRRQGWNG